MEVTSHPGRRDSTGKKRREKRKQIVGETAITKGWVAECAGEDRSHKPFDYLKILLLNQHAHGLDPKKMFLLTETFVDTRPCALYNNLHDTQDDYIRITQSHKPTL